MFFKMKKSALFVVFLLLISLVFAIPNLDEINNPQTSFSDYFVDVTDLGSDLNLSGYNLTATNGTFKNLLVKSPPAECSSGYFMTYTNMTTSICIAQESANGSLWNITGTNIYPSDITASVGIGTSSPDAKLDVKGTIHVADPSLTRYFIEAFSSGGVGYIDSYDSTGNDYQDLLVRADDFIFEGQGTERFRITDTGNVGIGLTNPSAPLEVIGNVSVQGNISADNFIGNSKTVATYIVAAFNSNNKETADYIADGTADEVEINYALSNLTNGGVVYLLEGTYNLSASITLVHSGTSLIGSGKGTKISSTSAISLINGGTLSNILIKNLYLDGIGTASSSTRGIYFTSLSNSRITGNWIYNVYYGVFPDAGTYNVITGNIFNTINRNDLDSGKTVFSNNVVKIYTKGTTIDGQYNVINGNVFEDGADEAISASSSSDYSTISNNAIYSSDQYGIRLVSTTFVSVTGNIVDVAQQYGIYLVGTNTDITVDGNVVFRPGYHGIYANTCDDCVFSNNIITNADSQNTKTYDGINIDGDSDNNIIIGNRIKDSDGHEIKIDDSTGDNNLISGNILIGTDHEGTINDSGTNTIISNNIEIVGGDIIMTGNYNFTDNVSADRFTGNQIQVENITSPFANKSYIFFQSDGSVGITLDPIYEIIPSVSAQEEGPNENEIITWQDGCRYRCVDGKCSGASGQTFYVNEDGNCIEREKAKSLKGTKLYLEINQDPKYPVTCSDWNWTSRNCEYKLNELSLINKDIPIKTGWINTTYDEKTGEIISEEFIEIKSQNIKFTSVSEKKNIPINVAHNEIIRYGDKSTVIILQDADTENLEDTYVHMSSPDLNTGINVDIWIASRYTLDERRGYFKFDITAIPSGQQIDDATLYLYARVISTAYDFDLHHVYNQTWIEGSLTAGDCSTPSDCGYGITWNNQPCGTAFDNADLCNLVKEDTKTSAIGWMDWSATNSVTKDYGEGNKNSSFVIWRYSSLQRVIVIHSKEYTTDITLRPYLNITYSPKPIVGITTTLVSPADESLDDDGDVTFNCTATPVFSNVTNISLYHNVSGTWDLIETNELLNGSYETTVATGFEVTGIANNTFLAWNCESFNNASNSSFATANYSLTVLYPLPYIKNPEFFIQNMTGGTLMKVTWLGDMWLRNDLTVVGDLTIDTNTLFVDSTNDLVGIGTIIPSHKLEVIGNITASGNITAGNVWLPTFAFAHTDVTMDVLSSGVWQNVTFKEEEAILAKITHTYNDATNDTFIIQDKGWYDITYSMAFSDSAPSPDGHVNMRIVKNNIEIDGSLLEEDTDKQYKDFTLSNGVIVWFEPEDRISFQFTADDTSIALDSHATYGVHKDTAVIKIKKIGQ